MPHPTISNHRSALETECEFNVQVRMDGRLVGIVPLKQGNDLVCQQMLHQMREALWHRSKIETNNRHDAYSVDPDK